MENQNDIDTTFSEASKASGEPVTFPGFEKVWDKVDTQLDQHLHPAPKKVPSWIPYGIAASIIIGSGIFFLTGKDQADHQSVTSVTAQKLPQPSKIEAQGSQNSQLADVTAPETIQKENSGKASENIVTRNIVVPPPLSTSMGQNEAASTSARSSVEIDDDDHRFRQSIAVNRKKKQAYEEEREADKEVIAKKVSGVQITTATANSGINSLSASDNGVSRKGYLSEVAPASIAGNTEDPDKPAFIQILSPGISIRVAPAEQGNTLAIQSSDPAFSAEDCLYIINNELAGIGKFRTLNAGNIKSVTVLTGTKAILLYGKKASRGIVIAETRDFSSTEVKKIRKALKKDSLGNP
ncbi:MULTISPECIES: hypothetical protein [Chryseobacterium]|uniref:Uncharacterized protein n=1 Tax=Chryseobacterium camelliae TaxID=1265445 RepID=A0ABU0TIA1_9FLAO|nr:MULTISPECIES: hypothetical protein [Chryseobacterium]MDT3409348.1 hypothetical protein [Pseudacidovorax intermedius]MDQ1096788.1 hypothetical protein [Chryseobacterium camelliae]MDQ1100730.1 hypothetical protein [Chryseobacterium sp. SORGH_AS_1048]MDR6088069.1 hypothetical protein [Chryseobacterium sp. SORGH_AS_0909]MDR6132444.1 hypothetical protein [Chryseobacterium sp. SORGH_AS_1175]